MSASPRILVVRRDNIGDLVCTMPLIAALRRRFPEGWIGALANSYNAPVLAGHPDLDFVYAYRKAKHGEAGPIAIARERVGLVLELRRMQLDYVVLATTAFVPRTFRLARLLAPDHIVGFVAGAPPARLDLPVDVGGNEGLHEVERAFRLAAAFGIEGPPPATAIAVDAAERRRVDEALAALPAGGPLVGVHISARKPSQRWPAERFVALMRALHERHGARFVLFWSPGAADHPQHPGDDDKARAMMSTLGGVPVLPWETHALSALVAGFAACERVICSDGGAMHVAAAIGKPILCFFGNSDATRWRPWGVPHELLQPASRDVTDVGVGQALAAWDALATRARFGEPSRS
jgi:ADP-heptose:LPS heptosyltransferase